ncbi:MAG TPA: AAA family ATPase [Mycobacteriales bacterium]|nr:AAA family ATPase [Mycobacteriales bacterium]
MAIEIPRTPLVGRVEELRQLADLVGADGEAHGTVLLGGDAGAGKSRLVAELSARVVADGWRVLVGHCLDFGDGSPPYLPFTDALGRLAAEDPQLVDTLAGSSPAIAGLLPARRLLSDSSNSPEPTGRAALFEAVQDALTTLAEDTPLLFIVEDLHWADQSTRDLLRWLFTRTFSSPVAILATYRSDDLHRQHPLRGALAEWVRLPAVTRLQLRPLSDDESRQMVSVLHPQSLAEAELRHILARAEGNPFFIEELVAATEVSTGLLPIDLADLLLVRLEQIGEAGRLTVQAAAVAGRRVSHTLLAYGSNLDNTALETALRAAVDANILVALGADGYGFRHALLAEAIYQDLLPGERVRLHAAYAEALATHRAEGSAAELARHARASHDLVTAARASVQAGDEAMAIGGPEEAIRHFELALELLADPRVAAGVSETDDDEASIDRVGLVIRASNAAAAAGHVFRAVALANDQLRALPADAPTHDRVRLIHTLATTAFVIDHKLDLLGLTTEGVKLMADEPASPLKAHILYVHARASADRARDDEAARWAGEALQIARDLDLAAVATDATLLLARLDERAGEPQSAEASIAAAIEQATAAGEPFAELRGLYNLASLHYGQGRLTQAIEQFSVTAARARSIGRQWAPYGLDAVLFGAIATHVSGDWALAAEMVDVSGQSPPELAEALLAAVSLEIAAGRGDIGALAAMPRLRALWQLDGLVAITSGGAAIELYGQSGDLAAAQAIHDDAVTTVTEMWRQMSFQARVRLAALLLGHLATAAGSATATDRAELVARGDELAAKAMAVAAEGRHTGPEGFAWASRVTAEQSRLRWLAGVDADPEEMLITAWREAVAAFERFGHVYETARSRARLAAVLFAAGHPAEAKAEVELARATAKRLGAKPLIDELPSLGAAGGSASRATTGRDDETLTPREHEVLLLVATGRSNREIAQQLFISAKTVSVHISNVLAKLDASSRTEAVAIARRRSLLD